MKIISDRKIPLLKPRRLKPILCANCGKQIFKVVSTSYSYDDAYFHSDTLVMVCSDSKRKYLIGPDGFTMWARPF